jgi:hypothetical protein
LTAKLHNCQSCHRNPLLLLASKPSSNY